MIAAFLTATLLHAVELPGGPTPDPVLNPHFPDNVHAFVWRNWSLVPAERMAAVIDATPEQVTALGLAMGLPPQPEITESQQVRSYISVIRRNWHLLPYEQMLELLGWTEEELAYTLREDDFLYIKLGNLKPKCPPLKYAGPTPEVKAREAAIAAVVKQAFPGGAGVGEEALFDFVEELSRLPEDPIEQPTSKFAPRYVSSYFALYGDPLLETRADSFPEGLLARLAATGVDGVWMQAVLYKLAPFPWEPEMSERYEERIENLRALVARARKYGIGIHLYLNEPRAMQSSFHEAHPGLKGVSEGEWSTMCTSVPEVQDYIRDSVEYICREVPGLAGFFTISGSENLTNCWSHGHGDACPRCKEAGPAEVIATLHRCIAEGIAHSGADTTLTAWDWGWRDDWAPGIIERLPKEVNLQSVSEWSIPIERGGVKTRVGEYSISTIGPGPRATKHWGLARESGHRTIAKIQANNTWELSPVPYIPAVGNVAQHAANLRNAGVNGIMLGWTLGGCPSPNLEVVALMGSSDDISPEQALEEVATRRYGPKLAPAVVKAWQGFSTAFSEFPYGGTVMYLAPQQMGPANPLWESPTGYHATMVCYPYDCLKAWRSIYPLDVFVGQFTIMADGFDAALSGLEKAVDASDASAEHLEALREDIDVARACAIHFRSVANQCRFVDARDRLAKAEGKDAAPIIGELEAVLESEIDMATRLHAIQCRDSRIGYEASNHYFYVPIDLVEKVVNCQDLLKRWLPAERARIAQ